MEAGDLIFGDLHGNHMMPNITVRDYIAMQAMQGLIVASSDSYMGGSIGESRIAEWAYDMAEAMIEQSNK